jgi:hypothetical protein
MPTKEWWATEWDRSEYDRGRYQAAKQQLIELLGGKCQVCGTTEDLQFDHVDPELKSFTITGRWNRSQEELQAELDKCQLLCGPHHREKTKADGRLGGGWNKLPEDAFRCGMARTYLKRKCRCGPCKKAHSLYKKRLIGIDEVITSE